MADYVAGRPAHNFYIIRFNKASHPTIVPNTRIAQGFCTASLKSGAQLFVGITRNEEMLRLFDIFCDNVCYVTKLY